MKTTEIVVVGARAQTSPGAILSSKTGATQPNAWSQVNGTPAESPAESPIRERRAAPKCLTRRSHTKSRRGCFTCKSRKIKCDEGVPACSQCVYRRATCTYPQRSQMARGAVQLPASPGDVFVPYEPSPALAAAAAANAAPQHPLSDQPVFTLQELRFFHYFLTSVKHPLPLGNHSVWVQEIPQMSHEYPFLLHAILALGASEMERSNLTIPFQYDVLKHRGRAISGLNKALANSKAWVSYGHADAILATCYALIFHSSRIPDGLKDFQVLVQGCTLITNKIRQSKVKTALHVTHDWPRQRIEPGLQHICANIPETHVALVRSSLASLREIQAAGVLVGDQPFWKAQTITLEQFLASPVEGYTFSIISYSGWYNFAVGLLSSLRQRDNWVAVVLMASLLANMVLMKVLIPLQVWPESRDHLPICTLRQMVQWVEVVYEHVDESRRHHLAWAKQILHLIPPLPNESYDGTTKPTMKSTKVDILNNLDTRAHMYLGDVLRLASEVTAWLEDYISSSYRAWQRTTALKTPGPIPVRMPTMDTPTTMSAAYPTPQPPETPVTSSTFHPCVFSSTLTGAWGSAGVPGGRSPDMSSLDSDYLPFRIFSRLDQSWDSSQGMYREKDMSDPEDQAFEMPQL